MFDINTNDLRFGHIPVHNVVEVVPKIKFIDIIGLNVAVSGQCVYLQCKAAQFSKNTYPAQWGWGTQWVAIVKKCSTLVTAFIPRAWAGD